MTSYRIIVAALGLSAACALGCSGQVAGPTDTTGRGAALLSADEKAAAEKAAGETVQEATDEAKPPPDPGSATDDAWTICAQSVKADVASGKLPESEIYPELERRCGKQPDTTTPPPPSPELDAYNACATEVKSRVIDGSIPIEQYEDTLLAKCGPAPTEGKPMQPPVEDPPKK